MPAQRTARAGEINGDPIDRWTLGHVGVGVWLGLFRAPWWVALATAIGWELIERPIKNNWPTEWGYYPTQDTITNSIVDVVAMMTGWGVIRVMPKPVYGRDN